jgi:tetratricopeptide (TPR) repeat protein
MNLPPILSLARAGATSRAWEAFVSAGLSDANSVEALTLKGRLLKDRARQAAGAERMALFAQSGAAYAQASTLRPDSYPLINAAAMALFAGDGASASSIAKDVLTLIDGDPTQGETPYWREASRAEALLLLERTQQAQDSLAAAIRLAPQAWEDHAATLRQFTAIQQRTGAPSDWLDPHRPPPALQFSGILGIAVDDESAAVAIDTAIERIAPGFGYGALAAGADILAAEAIVRHGAELHVVLPSDISEFVGASVAPFGDPWTGRFHALLETAASLTIRNEGQATSSAGIKLAEYRAMGMAAEKANLLETRAVAIRIEPDDRPTSGDPWLVSGRALEHVPVTVGTSTAPASARLPDGELTFLLALADDVGLAEPMGFTTLDQAVTAIPGGDIVAAIDCRTDQARDQVAALLQNATAGTVIASTDAAMALLAEGRCTRTEPLGEMDSGNGPVGVYAVQLARPG